MTVGCTVGVELGALLEGATVVTLVGVTLGTEAGLVSVLKTIAPITGTVTTTKTINRTPKYSLF